MLPACFIPPSQPRRCMVFVEDIRERHQTRKGRICDRTKQSRPNFTLQCERRRVLHAFHPPGGEAVATEHYKSSHSVVARTLPARKPWVRRHHNFYLREAQGDVLFLPSRPYGDGRAVAKHGLICFIIALRCWFSFVVSRSSSQVLGWKAERETQNVFSVESRACDIRRCYVESNRASYQLHEAPDRGRA
jgi:hypothetical protein